MPCLVSFTDISLANHWTFSNLLRIQRIVKLLLFKQPLRLHPLPPHTLYLAISCGLLLDLSAYRYHIVANRWYTIPILTAITSSSPLALLFKKPWRQRAYRMPIANSGQKG